MLIMINRYIIDHTAESVGKSFSKDAHNVSLNAASNHSRLKILTDIVMAKLFSLSPLLRTPPML
jgi:hypothetical protein